MLGGVEFEEEIDEIDDHIEEAVTAFTSSGKPVFKSPAPSYETPEPKSESTPPRSRATPEPQTVSGTSSSSVQKTVIKAEVVEPPSPRQQEVEDEDEDGEEDSEWDSEVRSNFTLSITVKPVLSGHSKKVKTKVLKTNGSLMKVESIAELEHCAILFTCIKC